SKRDWSSDVCSSDLFNCLSDLLIGFLLELTSLLIPLFHGTTAGLFCLVQSFISLILGLGSILHDCLARSLRVILRSIQPVASVVVDKAACGFAVILGGVAHVSDTARAGLLPIVLSVINIRTRFIHVGLCGVQQFLAGVLPVILVVVDVAGDAISGVFEPVGGLAGEVLRLRLGWQRCLDLLAGAL